MLNLKNLNKYYYYWFKKAGVNFNKDILNEIETKLPWIPKEYRKSIDILLFAICNHDYIIQNYDKIRPTSQADAELKFYAYVRHNPDIRKKIIDRFDACRAEFGFQYYGLVTIDKGRYNPLQTYIYEQITLKDTEWPNKVDVNNPETIESLKMLIRFVDITEIDSSKNDSLFYLYNCKISEELLRKISDENHIRDIIDKIRKDYPRLDQYRGLVSTSVSFANNDYYFDLIALPEYLRSSEYSDITERFNVRVSPKEKIVGIYRKN